MAAAGARNLHVIGTGERFPAPVGQEVEVAGEADGLAWGCASSTRWCCPCSAWSPRPTGPAPEEVRRVLGVGTYLYHLVVEPGSQLTPHHATHAGTGLASAHAAAARELETIRAHAPGRQELVDELAGATTAGLVRAQALLARELAPGDQAVAAATDPAAIRAALVKALGTTEKGHLPPVGTDAEPGARVTRAAGWGCRSVQNAARLLKEFGTAEGSLGVTELARRLGLGKSTVHRLLATLTAERILEHDPATGTYRLGLMMWELGRGCRCTGSCTTPPPP